VVIIKPYCTRAAVNPGGSPRIGSGRLISKDIFNNGIKKIGVEQLESGMICKPADLERIA
jgi:hypothetical protein